MADLFENLLGTMDSRRQQLYNQLIAQQQMQAQFPPFIEPAYMVSYSSGGFNFMGSSSVGVPSLSHFGDVRYFREKFKEYSKEDFRDLSNSPTVKEILKGSAMIPKEDVVERIKLYLENL